MIDFDPLRPSSTSDKSQIGKRKKQAPIGYSFGWWTDKENGKMLGNTGGTGEIESIIAKYFHLKRARDAWRVISVVCLRDDRQTKDATTFSGCTFALSVRNDWIKKFQQKCDYRATKSRFTWRSEWPRLDQVWISDGKELIKKVNKRKREEWNLGSDCELEIDFLQPKCRSWWS